MPTDNNTQKTTHPAISIRVEKKEIKRLRWSVAFISLITILAMILSGYMILRAVGASSQSHAELFLAGFLIGCQMLCAALAATVLLRMTVGMAIDMWRFLDDKNPLYKLLFKDQDDFKAAMHAENDKRMDIADLMVLVMSTKRSTRWLVKLGAYFNCCCIGTAAYSIACTQQWFDSVCLLLVSFCLVALCARLRSRYQRAVKYTSCDVIPKLIDAVEPKV